MLQRYSVRLRIYSWFMKYCHPKLASAVFIAVFPVVTLVGANTYRPASTTPPYQEWQQHDPPPNQLTSAWTQVQSYKQKQGHQTTKFRMGEKPLDWLPDFTTDPPLPHSCPRLLGTTSAGFRPRTPLTRKRPDSSHFTLHQLCKGNSIIRVRTRQSLRDSWI